MRKRSPKNVAVESGYYALDTHSGPDYDSVEAELSEMESDAAMALRRYLVASPGFRGPLPAELSRFVAWLAVRTPWLRRVADERWARFFESAADGREEIPDDPLFGVSVISAMSGAEMRVSVAEAIALVRSGEWRPQLDRNQRIDVMRLQAWYFLQQHFPRLNWFLLTAPPNGLFVTSDRPVVWFTGDGYSDQPAALKQSDVQLTVPVSARYALLALGRIPAADFRISPDEVNRRTVYHAERFIVSPDPRLLTS